MLPTTNCAPGIPQSIGNAFKFNEIGKAPLDVYGSSGVRITGTPSHLLEGFRKGRIVRVFGSGWPLKDQFYGESLMGYGYERLQTAEIMEIGPKEYPTQFPFRTDYGNENLPWFTLKPAEIPPHYSEHCVLGDIVKVDDAKRTGQFRTERSGRIGLIFH